MHNIVIHFVILLETNKGGTFGDNYMIEKDTSDKLCQAVWVGCKDKLIEDGKFVSHWRK